MARLSIAEMDKNISEQGSYQASDYKFIPTLYLKDKQSAFVKILLKNIEDVEVHSVHKVRMTSKKGKEYSIDVDCLGKGCPLCQHVNAQTTQEKFPLVTKARDMVYVPLVQVFDADGNPSLDYKILSRSSRWYRNTMCEAESRYGLDEVLEIQRSGQGVDTTYGIYSVKKGPKGAELPKLDIDKLKADLDIADDDISGRKDSLIKTWDADQMEEYLETKQYPTDHQEAAEEEEEVKPRTRTSNYGF